MLTEDLGPAFRWEDTMTPAISSAKNLFVSVIMAVIALMPILFVMALVWQLMAN